MDAGTGSLTDAYATCGWQELTRAELAVTSDSNTIHCGAYHVVVNKILFSH
jgi:hypothetical protein